MAKILIKGATVLTMEEHDAVFPGGEVAIAGDRIIAVGPQGCVLMAVEKRQSHMEALAKDTITTL